MSEHLKAHKDDTPGPSEWSSHPIEITHAAMFEQKVEYIHNNPVEEGGALPEHYAWSSAHPESPWKMCEDVQQD